jgi:putative SOS response-associated peptidase YedK
MCARVDIKPTVSTLVMGFQAEASQDARKLDAERPLTPRYNAAPAQRLPVILRAEDGRRVLEAFRWGLVPSWAKDLSIGNKTINARAETILTSPAFRSAIKSRRCLLPVTGYYEWIAGDGKTRIPFHIQRRDGQMMAFAGLWETWTSPEKTVVRTFTVCTVEAAPAVTHLHNRMPAILDPGDYDNWMDTKRVSAPDAATLLRPYDAEGVLQSYQVSQAVNSWKNEGPELILPIT